MTSPDLFFILEYLLTKTELIMGKGDLKSKRGKISRGTFGASRPKKEANRRSHQEKLGINKK